MSWLVAGAAPRQAVVERQLRPFHNGSQSLSSQLALPRALWATGAPVTCMLSHPDLPSHVEAVALRELGEAGSRAQGWVARALHTQCPARQLFWPPLSQSPEAPSA